jgi:hypothetical protein
VRREASAGTDRYRLPSPRNQKVGSVWRGKRGVATGYARRARGEREIELSSTAAGEEVVGDEGDQRHEHDRPEQGGEQQREQNSE